MFDEFCQEVNKKLIVNMQKNRKQEGDLFIYLVIYFKFDILFMRSTLV